MEGLIIVWIGVAAVVGFIADARGRSGFGFFALGVVLSPLLAGLVLALLPDLEKERIRELERKREHERELNAIKAIAANAHAAPAPAPMHPSTAGELERLAALRDKGVLTEEEFASQKTKLLAAS